MTRPAYIIIRPRNVMLPMSGKNIEILVDGKELQYVSNVSFSVAAGELASLTIDFCSPPAEIRGIFAVADMPPVDGSEVHK